jgi:peptidoglycan hydrolase-like protein with peptidoglycan-binding domain
METRRYQRPGLTMRKGAAGTKDEVRDLQRDLRALGYLKRHIDGDFGGDTELAVKGFQHDLLHNAGAGRDGKSAPVKMTDFAKGRVPGVSGIVDQGLVACIVELMDDARVAKLPRAADPVAENAKVVQQLETMPATVVPTPFLLAILKQESGLKHYAEPRAGDDDTFIIVGTDRGAPEPHVITSRGYGVGQYTLFHHPPHPEEVDAFMRDPRANVQRAAHELREKFDAFVVGSASKSDDRMREIGAAPAHPLRGCKHPNGISQFMTDCAACVLAAGAHSLATGTPVFDGSATLWGPTRFHEETGYTEVPRRDRFDCDWPYAVRRYNGGGLDSFHYQAQVLKHLAAL